MTPDGIARMVPGVSVLYFPTHFNLCPYPLNTINFRSPTGDQLIFMSIEARLAEGVCVVRVDFVYLLRMKGGFF